MASQLSLWLGGVLTQAGGVGRWWGRCSSAPVNSAIIRSETVRLLLGPVAQLVGWGLLLLLPLAAQLWNSRTVLGLVCLLASADMKCRGLLRLFAVLLALALVVGLVQLSPGICGISSTFGPSITATAQAVHTIYVQPLERLAIATAAPTDRPVRVLAVVTGGWAMPSFDTPVRYAVLHAQLQNYVAACEAGYDVHVVLASYDTWNSTGKLDLSKYYCERIMSTIPLTCSLFEFEKTPNGTFGTGRSQAWGGVRWLAALCVCVCVCVCLHMAGCLFCMGAVCASASGARLGPGAQRVASHLAPLPLDPLFLCTCIPALSSAAAGNLAFKHRWEGMGGGGGGWAGERQWTGRAPGQPSLFHSSRLAGRAAGSVLHSQVMLLHSDGRLAGCCIHRRHHPTPRRLVFKDQREKYDLFISQEDDASVLAHHMSYFIKWAASFSGSDLYPGFINYEVATWKKSKYQARFSRQFNAVGSSNALCDYSIKHTQVFEEAGDLFAIAGSRSRIYMLTQAMLLNVSSRQSWLGDLKTVKGEFNVFFGTPSWLNRFYRVVVPLRDLPRALIHHVGDRYVNFSGYVKSALNTTDKPKEELFNALSIGEAMRAFSNCSRSLGSALGAIDKADAKFNLTHSGDCSHCLKEGQAASVHIVKPWAAGFATVQWACKSRAQAQWTNYEGLSKLE